MSHVPLFAHGKRARSAHRRRRRLRHRRGGAQAQYRQTPHPSRNRPSGHRIRQRAFPGIHQAGVCRQRFESVIDDGMKYVAQTERRFDVIIVDSTDPQGPGKVLFSQKFYAGLQTLPEQGRRPGHAERRADVPAARTRHPASLNSVGCLRTQAAMSPPFPPMSADTWRWASLATTGGYRRTPVKTIAARYRKAGSFATKYWTPEVHAAAFALPRFIADIVARARRGR